MAERSTVEILRAAKARITPEEAWTKGMYARDDHGCDVEPNAAEATCWCAAGSLFAEEGVDSGVGTPGRDDSEALALLTEVAKGFVDGGGIAKVNDRRGHEAVLAMYDRAIQLAEVGS